MPASTIASHAPNPSTNPSRARLRDFVVLLLPGALVAATLDAVFAVVAYVFVLGRYSLVETLQYIAAGALGAAAFDGGLATAGLGVLLHMGLAFGFAALYAAVAARLPPMSRLAAAGTGLAYGAGIWTVMSLVVLPLTGVPEAHDGAAFFVAFLLGHAFLVGLPIALGTRAGLLRREG